MSENEIKLPEGLSVEEATDVLREYGTTDEAQIVNSETLDSLKAEIEEAKKAFAAVLAEESPQSADTLSRQDMDALTEPFRDEEGEIDVDTLRQIPETGEVETDTLENEPEDTEVDLDSLSLSERDKITNTMLPKLTTFQSRGMENRVDTLKKEIAETVGADSYEDIADKLGEL